MVQNSRTASAVRTSTVQKSNKKHKKKCRFHYSSNTTIAFSIRNNNGIISKFTNSISRRWKQLFICNKTINICGFRSIWYGMYQKIDYRIYQKKMYKPIYLFVILLLLAVPIIGYEVGGAKRWINIFDITSFQPSEAAKNRLILFLQHI